MESPAPQFVTPAETQKKPKNGLIIGIVVAIVLCCCCLAVVVGGLALAGPAVNNVFEGINKSLQNPTLPEVPSMPFGTSEPGIPAMPDETSEPANPDLPALSSDVVPQGGYGDDLLRTNTWPQVILAAALTGKCNTPSASETTISVSQEPDSNGIWKEVWLVACGAGKTLPVDVTFTPSASGGTDISVTVPK